MGAPQQETSRTLSAISYSQFPDTSILSSGKQPWLSILGPCGWCSNYLVLSCYMLGIPNVYGRNQAARRSSDLNPDVCLKLPHSKEMRRQDIQGLEWIQIHISPSNNSLNKWVHVNIEEKNDIWFARCEKTFWTSTANKAALTWWP